MTTKTIKNIAVLTSGGDAPGMNSAIVSIAKACATQHINLFGIRHGYHGLVHGDFQKISWQDCKQHSHRGGTFLKSARCKVFPTAAGAKRAAEHLTEMQIDALLVIGGDGSFQGAVHLAQFWPGQIIGLPGTIDNDILGSDFTIGFATAVDTAVSAIDKLRDTADAFDRIFLVEVMGRHCPELAHTIAAAVNAEYTISPLTLTHPQQELQTILQDIGDAAKLAGESSYIVVVAENCWPDGVMGLAKTLSQDIGIDCRAMVLGHIQRGGDPLWPDRLLASKLGREAVLAAIAGANGVMLGEVQGQLIHTPLANTRGCRPPLSATLLALGDN